MFKVSSLIIYIIIQFFILIFYRNVPNWHYPMQKQEDQQMRERQKSAATL